MTQRNHAQHQTLHNSAEPGLQATGGARMYLIGFAPDKNVDPKTYFDLKEPMPADKQLLFLSVSAYEPIFKDQP